MTAGTEHPLVAWRKRIAGCMKPPGNRLRGPAFDLADRPVPMAPAHMRCWENIAGRWSASVPAKEAHMPNARPPMDLAHAQSSNVPALACEPRRTRCFGSFEKPTESFRLPAGRPTRPQAEFPLKSVPRIRWRLAAPPNKCDPGPSDPPTPPHRLPPLVGFRHVS